MPILDIFNNDAFKSVEMSEAIDLVETVPGHIGSLNIFNERGIRTEAVAIEKRAGSLSVIPTSPRGAPLDQRETEKRTVRNFNTVRIAKADRIMASELAFIRQMGEESAVIAVQEEIARRLSGPLGLINEVQMTHERMRLGAVQGKVLDADNTDIYNYYTEFAIAEGAEINFDLATLADGALRELCEKEVVVKMRRLANGAAVGRPYAMCGDQFWYDLHKNPEFRASYLAQEQARELRSGTDLTVTDFAGISWVQYVGSDDNAKVAIASDKARFFPRNPNAGIFETVFAPGESFSDIGMVGLPVYAKVIPDRDREHYVDLEVYSYPLHIARRPDLLLRGKRA